MARRQGMPLVVTDEAGKSPVVVLPLEVYEALIEGGGSAPEIFKPTGIPNSSPKNIEISMEERFYIEPLEDQENT